MRVKNFCTYTIYFYCVNITHVHLIHSALYRLTHGVIEAGVKVAMQRTVCLKFYVVDDKISHIYAVIFNLFPSFSLEFTKMLSSYGFFRC